MSSNIFKAGREAAPIVIVTDWTSPASRHRGQHLPDRHNNMLIAHLRDAGISMQDCVLVNPCPTNPEWEGKPPSERQHANWVGQFKDEFWEVFLPVSDKAKAVLVLGKSAARQVFGKPVKVTKARGAFQQVDGVHPPVIVTLSPAHVLSRPEVERDFVTDLKMLGALQAGKWKGALKDETQGNYELVTDLSKLLKKPPKFIAGDTETTSLRWAVDASIISIQLSVEPGHAYVIPVSAAMWPDIPRAERMRGVSHVRKILANPDTKVFGHNFKFDLHMLDLLNIKVANWWLDTLQLLFCVDENMQSKSLKEGIRRYVPEMAGYSDAFDEKTDKSNMLACDPIDLINYGGGDTDGTFRLCSALTRLVKKDKGQWDNLMKIQMPALRMFYRMEKQGMKIDTRRLRQLGVVTAERSYDLESALLRMVPKKVKQKHFDAGLSFGRKEFLQDILFSADGFGLRAVRTVSDGSPSLDATHLANFQDNKFVSTFTEFQKVQKMKSTYVGVESGMAVAPVKLLKAGGWPVAVRRMTNYEPEEMQTVAKLETRRAVGPDGDDLRLDILTEPDATARQLGRDQDGSFWLVSESEPTGFWKHLAPDGKIHPSFFLDRTVTGRSSSRDPNFQNVPKRASSEAQKAMVKAYRGVFIPSSKRRILLECDQSQAELRFAAEESMDPVMLKTYREGGDIHALTASKVAGVKMDKVTKDLRQKAKAVNFGFLYTMGVDGFIIYARTQYGVHFTKPEAERIRELYFQTYAKLRPWHEKRKQEARRNGYVRGLLGAVRHLPSIYSSDRGVQAEAERQAINSPIQRVASDITLMSMIQFSDGCPDWILPLGTIHDSGIVEVDRDKAQKAASWIKWCFINPPIERLFGVKLHLPLGADVAIGPDLGDMEELKEVTPVKPPWIRR